MGQSLRQAARSLHHRLIGLLQHFVLTLDVSLDQVFPVRSPRQALIGHHSYGSVGAGAVPVDKLRLLRNYVRKMRTPLILRVLFPEIRSKILAVLLLHPEKRWFLTELAQHLGTRPSSLQREVEALSRAGLLQQTKDGRRVYFQAETRSPVFSDLKGLLEKTVGLIPVLREEVDAFGERIRLAFLYGSTARSEESTESDVDLMIVGDVGLSELVPLLRRTERRLGRPVNPTIYSDKEFKAKVRNQDHFLTTVLRGAKQFVKGNDDELATVAGKG